MSLAVPRTAPIAVLVACALCAAPAHAQERGDVLVAQIAQADGAPGGQPPLTTDPPVPLGGDQGGEDPEPTATPTATATPEATATATPTATAAATDGDAEELPDTGYEALFTALAGVALLGSGLSLRWSLPDAAR